MFTFCVSAICVAIHQRYEKNITNNNSLIIENIKHLQSEISDLYEKNDESKKFLYDSVCSCINDSMIKAMVCILQ